MPTSSNEVDLNLVGFEQSIALKLIKRPSLGAFIKYLRTKQQYLLI